MLVVWTVGKEHRQDKGQETDGSKGVMTQIMLYRYEYERARRNTSAKH